MKWITALVLVVLAYANVADAARDVSGEASRKLGMRYYRGEGVPLDYRKAVQHLSRAVDLGDAEAAHNLGKMYEFGMGVEASQELSAKWYTAGAELGDPASQFQASIAYYKGEGVPRDRAQAAKWWTLAIGYSDFHAKRYGPTIEQVESNLTAQELAEGKRLAAEWMRAKGSTRSGPR